MHGPAGKGGPVGIRLPPASLRSARNPRPNLQMERKELHLQIPFCRAGVQRCCKNTAQIRLLVLKSLLVVQLQGIIPMSSGPQ